MNPGDERGRGEKLKRVFTHFSAANSKTSTLFAPFNVRLAHGTTALPKKTRPPWRNLSLTLQYGAWFMALLYGRFFRLRAIAFPPVKADAKWGAPSWRWTARMCVYILF